MTDDPRHELDDAADAPVSGGADAAPEDEREWWDDPGLPWHHKPEKADIACLSALGFVGVYGMVMLPLRPALLGLAPHVLGSLGYRTGIVLTGALAATGDAWWPLVLVVGSLMAIKFDWIYWWAGRLWGRNIVDVWAKDKSARSKRNFGRAWNLAHRYETLAIFLTYLPIPLPQGVIYVALGAAGTKLTKFLIVDMLAALVSTAIYLYLGFAIGEPAVQLVETYSQWLWKFSIALIIGMIAWAWWKSRQKKKDAAAS